VKDKVKNPAASPWSLGPGTKGGEASPREKAPEDCRPQPPAYHSSPPQAVEFSSFFHINLSRFGLAFLVITALLLAGCVGTASTTTPELTPVRTSQPTDRVESATTAVPTLTPATDGQEIPQTSETATPTPLPSSTRLLHVVPYEVEINPQLPLYTLVFRMPLCNSSTSSTQAQGPQGWFNVYREGVLWQTIKLDNDSSFPYFCCQDNDNCPVKWWMERLRAEDINFDGYLDMGYDQIGGSYWSTPRRWLFDETSGSFYTNALTEELSEIGFGSYTTYPQFREIRFSVGAATHREDSIYYVADDQLVLMYERQTQSHGKDSLTSSSHTRSVPSMTDTTFTHIPEDQLPPRLWWSLATAVSQGLATSVYEVEPLSWERVDWSDSCLGVPGDQCEEGTVPGYRIWVSVGDREYEYHSAAFEPYGFLLAAEQVQVPDIKDPILIYERHYEGSESCSRLSLAGDGQGATGSCDGRSQQPVRIPEVHVPLLAEMAARFAPFQITVESDYWASQFILQGQGEIASPAWQRAIARWADRMWKDVRHSSPWCVACDTALYRWLPEVPGRPGYCGRLTVLDYGQASAWIEACSDPSSDREFSGWAWLETDEWETFDRWLSDHTHFCVSSRSDCSWFEDAETPCDTLAGLSCFSGLGEQEMSEEALAELTNWAERVFTRLTD
jgi:hypothetical protein